MKNPFRLPGLPGFALYTALLAGAILCLPALDIDDGTLRLLAGLGTLAAWRYAWGLTHFARALLYIHFTFPALRKDVQKQGDALMPPQIYLLLTSFRIHADTTLRVYRAAIREASACGVPCVLVCSIVELGDEFLIKELFRAEAPPPSVRLVFVRIQGTGKRDALAQGFRAISRDLPLQGAVAAVIDGDSILSPGLLRATAPFFARDETLGALTTDEDCEVEGTPVQTDWHRLRFAQRHLQMASLSLSDKVMTLTGRMSMFRADIVTDRAFIEKVENDALDHWRLGSFRFLTGDDKSTWHWVLAAGWNMLYVPDVCVTTVEHPPSRNFLKASARLMFRWSGNMLRTNGRALSLGPRRTGFFLWWCLLDQRVTIWTGLAGPVFALFLSMRHSVLFLAAYLVWIGCTRWVMTLLLLAARRRLSWRYPFLLFYNQVAGAMVKSFALFRLDRQSWTRQNTTLDRNVSALRRKIEDSSSLLLHATALAVFITAIGLLSGVLKFIPPGF